MTERGEEMGWGGRRERELWNTDSWRKKTKGSGGGGGGVRGMIRHWTFQTSQGMNGKTGVPGGNPLVGCSENL